jgi:hypothetical protein
VSRTRPIPRTTNQLRSLRGVRISVEDGDVAVPSLMVLDRVRSPLIVPVVERSVPIVPGCDGCVTEGGVAVGLEVGGGWLAGGVVPPGLVV